MVQIAVDQLRSDYLEAYSSHFSENGIRRLLTDGRIYTNASYPFQPIDRASATATMSTGTTPFYHGIVGINWINRETLRPVFCADGTPEALNTTTIGDEMKLATSGKSVIYAIAPTSDSAILLAGHAADGAIWYDTTSKLWTSSTFYDRTASWLKTYNRTMTVTSLNDGVTDLAINCIESHSMGRDDDPDLLAVSYQVGEDDISYMQLDRQIERLIKHLQIKVGMGRVLYVLTSTGYTSDDTKDYKKYHIPTGTFNMQRSANLLNMYLAAIYGQGKYVDTAYKNDIYLNHALIEQKNTSLHDVLEQAQSILMQMQGVRDVYTSTRLFTNPGLGNEKVRAGFDVSRRGDIILEIAPGWNLHNEDTNENHVQRMTYMQFPILLMGPGVSHARVEIPVTTDRIAPTICRSIRIRAPNACTAEPLF